MTTTPIRRKLARAARRDDLRKQSTLPQDNRTQHLLLHLEGHPMTRAEAIAYVSSNQFKRLKEASAIELYDDINPEYEKGICGQKPLCKWVRRGCGTYNAGPQKKAGEYYERTVQHAIKVLNAMGYTVTGPDVPNYKESSASRPDILTASGNYFNFLMPAKNAVLVTDIAHALARVCRFNGHTREFYSVAQHSVLVSEIVAPEFALVGLFHDATEAYIGDVTRPLKNLLPDYRAIEARLQADIFKKLGLPEHIPAEVKTADLILLATEQRDLMPEHNDEWAILKGIDLLPDSIVPWSSEEAEEYFLDRYRELVGDHKVGGLRLVSYSGREV